MRIGDKIKILMKERGFKSINALHKAMQTVFGEETLSRRSLTTLFNQDVKLREGHLFQFTLVLGVKRSELIKGTTLVRQLKDDTAVFPYSDRAVLYCLNKTDSFALMRLKLMGNSRTNQEQDPLTSSGSVKDIYVLAGKMSVIIRKDEKESRINLKKGQSFSFDARQPHYFENTSDRMNETLIVHAPVKNSVFFAS